MSNIKKIFDKINDDTKQALFNTRLLMMKIISNKKYSKETKELAKKVLDDNRQLYINDRK